MQIPIPDDWNGQDWQCVQVEFPDSPLWTAILLGLLSYATRARVWDGDSGSILDVQAIGREIWSRNFPLNSCNGEIDSGGNETITPTEIYGGLDMACCTLPYGSIRWNNGVLEYKTCDGWEAVPGVSGQAEWPVDDDTGTVITPPDGYFETATSCSKALAFTAVVFDVVDSLLDSAFEFDTPFEAVQQVKNRQPGLDGGDTHWLSGYSAALVVAAQGYDTTVKDADIQQDIVCRVAQVMTAGNAGMTAEDYETVKNVVNAYLSNTWTLLTHPTAYASMQAIYREAMAGIGSGDARKITEYAQPTLTDDCSCPGSGPAPTPSIWFTGVDTIVPDTGTAWEYAQAIDSGRRIRLTLAHVASSIGRVTGTAHLLLAGYTPGDNIKVRLYFGDGDDEIYNDWFDTCPQPSSAYMNMGFNGVDAGPRSNQANYYEFETDNSGAQTLNFIDFLGGRWCPHYDGPFVRTNVYIEIVEINGVAFTPLGPA